MTSGTMKCPVCGRPYKWYGMKAGDQSACPRCVQTAEAATRRPDTRKERERRERAFGGW